MLSSRFVPTLQSAIVPPAFFSDTANREHRVLFCVFLGYRLLLKSRVILPGVGVWRGL